MAYTPINWATGDTITADKLNKMDNGWGVGSTQLFSETVTTVAGSDGNYAWISYEELINADTITVTLDGTNYDCNRIDFEGSYFYGGFSTTQFGPDYTDYPFYIVSDGGDGNMLYTETAGSHTITVSTTTLQTSAGFAEAVSESIGGAFYRVTSGVTTWQEIANALGAGKVVFYSFLQESDEFGQFYLIACADTDGNGTYRVHLMSATNAGIYTDTVTAASANAPLRF